MSQVPFLPLKQRVQFLSNNGFIDNSPLAPFELNWLQTVNFHFLLGYARHYRKLVDEGYCPAPKCLSGIKNIIDTEGRLAAFLTPWIRRAEYYLRALVVKHYCSAQLHGEGYLDYRKWSSKKSRCRQIQYKILGDIYRYDEPYVKRHIQKRSSSLNIEQPKRLNQDNRDTWVDLLDGLPLWAVIDSFSIGTLGQFIQSCGEQPSGSKPVSELIARELGINKGKFNVSMEGFGVTRNLVFHHQRLWMRPMPKSPGISNDLARRYSGYNFGTIYKEAHFIALVNISRFLPQADREEYLDGLDKFMDGNKLYALGIMQPPFLRFTSSTR